ncbi:MAG: hypothetical protein ACREJX_19870, partial [Polyangiaceae bacterium]
FGLVRFDPAKFSGNAAFVAACVGVYALAGSCHRHTFQALASHLLRLFWASRWELVSWFLAGLL